MPDYTEERPWGSFTTHDTNVKMKTINVKGMQRLSLQSHEHRDEYWFVRGGYGYAEVDGKTIVLDRSGINSSNVVFVPKGSKHRLEAGAAGLLLVEFQVGDVLEESDIIRYEDDYGRVKK
jgi:mannose-6-phosphate isomerase-like protein (cupin superfamily)